MILFLIIIFFTFLIISIAWNIGKEKAKKFMDDDYNLYQEHKREVEKLIKK